MFEGEIVGMVIVVVIVVVVVVCGDSGKGLE